jgi:hypothetical protein
VPRWILFAGMVSLAGCESPSSPAPPPPERRLVVLGTAPAEADVVATPLSAPIRAVVADDFGQVIAGAVVAWSSVDPDAGAPQTPTSTTDAEGRASTVWTLGTRVGGHRVEVRATHSGRVAVDTVIVRAGPGPLATAEVTVGDTLRTLDPGETVGVTVTGMDAYGNAVPDPYAYASFSVADSAVAAVSQGGVIEARGAGRTTVTIEVDSIVRRIHLTVRGLRQRAHPSLMVTGVYGTGNNVFATTLTGGRRFWRWNGLRLVEITGRTVYEDAVVVLPGGEIWAGSGHPHRRAAGSTTWTAHPLPGGQPVWRLTGSGQTVFAEGVGYGGFSSAVFRWDGSQWTPLPLPARGDSTLTIHSLAAGGSDDLYVGGRIVSGGGERPYLARVRGGVATRIDVAPGLPPGAGSGVVGPMAALPDGSVYVVVATADPWWAFTRLAVIDEGVLTSVPVPWESQEIVSLALGPDGALHVAGVDRVARLASGGWETWELRDYWNAYHGPFHVTADGRIWLGGYRGGDDHTGFLEIEVLR